MLKEKVFNKRERFKISVKDRRINISQKSKKIYLYMNIQERNNILTIFISKHRDLRGISIFLLSLLFLSLLLL